MDNTSLDEIANQFNTFNQEIPAWALLLMQSMKTVIDELKLVKDLAKKVHEFEEFKIISSGVSTKLQEENQRLNDKIKILEDKIDDQEQRSRNNCLLIHGCPEMDGEDTDNVALDVMNIKVGLLDIPKSAIFRSHRVGPKANQRRSLRSSASPRPRPIIVRFASWKIRERVFKNKKELKGKGISISESLTKIRYNLLKAAEEKLGRGKVWSNGGFIVSKVDDKYVTIYSANDL